MTATHATHDVPKGREVLPELVQRVEADFAEMPGLSITVPQGQRLWSMDRQACERVFRVLLDRGFLRQGTKGRFLRA